MNNQENITHWEDDKLGRIESAKFLTTYLNGIYAESSEDIYLDSFVLNINSGWGFGKTFFLKHWMKDLKKENHPVIYFDAWENDYSEDPLLAFIAELESELKKYQSKIPNGEALVEGVLKAARRAIAPTLSIITNAITRKILGDTWENIAEVYTKTGDADEKTNLAADQIGNFVNSAVENSISEHRAIRTAIQEFKNSLATLVKKLKEVPKIQLPMYILVDELDRCRPTYAIELLEGIKHIFGVNGVFFIVATNKNQLNHSISAIYGDGFDSSGYLRRFFDQEYLLPKPDNKNFANYLTNKFRLETDSRFFTLIQTKSQDQLNPVARTFSLISEVFGASLRDQMQAMRQLKAITLSSKMKSVHIMYLIFLIMFKQHNEDKFNLFLEKTDRLELQNILVAIVSKNISFESYKIDNYGHSLIEEISLDTILFEYRMYAFQNATDLYKLSDEGGTRGRLLNKLREEAPQSYSPEKFYPLSIADYPELVRQAGHLL